MLIHDIICSNIRIAELKLKRIRLEKERLLDSKPFFLNRKEINKWHDKLNNLEKEESLILSELQSAYTDLEEYI